MPGQFEDAEFGVFSILFEKKLKGIDVCYFAGYSNFTNYPEHVYDYLKRLLDVKYEIVFISSSKISSTSLSRLKELCAVVIEKENKGTDFGAWKIALDYFKMARSYKHLMLANDSVFGPFRSIRKDIVELNEQYDIWGYSSSLEINYHLQSYFLHVNSKVLQSEFWLTFWNSVKYISVKKEVVENYEVGFTQKAIAARFRVGAFADAKRLANDLRLPSNYLNYTISAWKELIVLYNYPLLKKELVTKELAHSTNGGWASVVKTVFGAQHLTNIEEFLLQYRDEFMQGNDVKFRVSSKDVIVLSHYGKKLTVSQIMALNFASQVAEILDQPFLLYQLSNKKHEIGFQHLEHTRMRYLGALASDLLEQYIYHWNKFNIRAIIIDRESFALFRSFFESFYSGNIIVVDSIGSDILIDYLIRTHPVKSLVIPLEGHQLDKLQHSILVKSSRNYLESDDFRQLKNVIEESGLLLQWKE